MNKKKHNRNNPVAKRFNETTHKSAEFYIEALDQKQIKTKDIGLRNLGYIYLILCKQMV